MNIYSAMRLQIVRVLHKLVVGPYPGHSFMNYRMVNVPGASTSVERIPVFVQRVALTTNLANECATV